MSEGKKISKYKFPFGLQKFKLYILTIVNRSNKQNKEHNVKAEPSSSRVGKKVTLSILIN